MKRSLILSAIILSFMLAACSQSDSSISPVSPVFNKKTETPGISTSPFPFPLYTAFKSLTVKQMLPNQQPGIVTVELTKDMPKRSIVFAVISYNPSGPVPMPVTDKEMVFLDHQTGSKIDVPVTAGKKVESITIYRGDAVTSIDVNYYQYGQKFKFFGVQGWKFTPNSIVISAANSVANASHIYTEVMYNGASKLIFIQKPSSSVFSVPGITQTGITGVNVYGIPESLPIVSAK